jgi:hypothetical protein
MFSVVALGNCQISVSKNCLKPASCFCEELGGKHCHRTSCHIGAWGRLDEDEPMRFSLDSSVVRWSRSPIE